MFLKDLLAKRGTLAAEAAPLIAKDKAEDDELTDDELVRFEELVGELEGLDVEIKAKEEGKAARAQSHQFLESQIDAVAPQPSGRKTTPGAVALSVTDMKLALEKDPNKGYKSPRDFINDVINDTNGRQRRVQNRDAMTLLSFRNPDFQATVGSDEAGEYADPRGGFLLPAGFTPDILKLDPEPDPTAGRTTKIPMETVTVTIPARVDKNHSDSVTGGFTVTRKAETVAGTASRQLYEQVQLRAHTLFGLAYATEELLVDSPSSFAAIIAAGFNDEFTNAQVRERFGGTGVGEFMGILNSPCVVSIGKEDGQTASTLVYANIIKMRARAWHYQDAIWMANLTVLPELMLLNQSVGVGGAILWQPSAREDHPDLLLGRPLVFTESVKALGTTGDIWCANWSQYLEGTLQPLQSAESVHVRFTNNEVAFKFWLRNAGAPWWRTPLTPENGETLSPFVKLDERT